jgi:hypothetical protein
MLSPERCSWGAADSFERFPSARTLGSNDVYLGSIPEEPEHMITLLETLSGFPKASGLIERVFDRGERSGRDSGVAARPVFRTIFNQPAPKVTLLDCARATAPRLNASHIQ